MVRIGKDRFKNYLPAKYAKGREKKEKIFLPANLRESTKLEKNNCRGNGLFLPISRTAKATQHYQYRTKG